MIGGEEGGDAVSEGEGGRWEDGDCEESGGTMEGDSSCFTCGGDFAESGCKSENEVLSEEDADKNGSVVDAWC